jgi:hypothetical protein
MMDFAPASSKTQRPMCETGKAAGDFLPALVRLKKLEVSPTRFHLVLIIPALPQ